MGWEFCRIDLFKIRWSKTVFPTPSNACFPCMNIPITITCATEYNASVFWAGNITIRRNDYIISHLPTLILILLNVVLKEISIEK